MQKTPWAALPGTFMTALKASGLWNSTVGYTGYGVHNDVVRVRVVRVCWEFAGGLIYD